MKNINNQWIVHILVGAVVTSVWIFLSNSNFLTWVTSFTTFLIGSIGSAALINRHNRLLSKRMHASDGEVITWSVLMNGVDVGTVTDAEYAAIQKYAFNDWHNAATQLFNIGYGVATIFSRLVTLVPFAAFWVATAAIFFAPESFDVFHETEPSHMILAAKALVNLSITLSIMVIGFMLLIGYKFGFRNVYSDSVGRMVRNHLRVAIEADIVLIRVSAVDFQHEAINS